MPHPSCSPHPFGTAPWADEPPWNTVGAPAPRSASPGAALAIVIDCSQGMAGAPLQAALASAVLLASRLDANDRVALVAFANDARLVLPVSPATQRRALHAAFQSLDAAGHCNLFAGWKTGALALAALGEGVGPRRVVLFSHGRADVGVTDPDRIRQACALLALQGVTTTACGVGPDIDAPRLVAMASAGGGGYHRGEHAADFTAPLDGALGRADSATGRLPGQDEVIPGFLRRGGPAQARGARLW